jgi:AraC family transcriptional regulator
MIEHRVATQHHRPDTVAFHAQAAQRVIHAMSERLDQPFSLEEMSELAIMSPFHFNRTFRELTGIPPCQFLSAVRLQAAKRLLLTTDLSVTDICFEVGYNSLGTFIRRFTDLVGLSPRRLRSMARAQPAAPGTLRTVRRRAPQPGARVKGLVTAPPDYQGPVYVGLFAGPVPQGRPVACSLLSAPGPFRIPHAPDGVYSLFAAGGADGEGHGFLQESALRGGGQEVRVAEGVVTGSTEVTLRPADSFDPPILLALKPLARGQA